MRMPEQKLTLLKRLPELALPLYSQTPAHVDLISKVKMTVMTLAQEQGSTSMQPMVTMPRTIRCMIILLRSYLPWLLPFSQLTPTSLPSLVTAWVAMEPLLLTLKTLACTNQCQHLHQFATPLLSPGVRRHSLDTWVRLK